MKKVIYSITRVGKTDPKMTGIGYITDTDLVIACVSQKGKPYVRIFEDCVSECLEVGCSNGEFKGDFREYKEIEVEVKTSYGESRGYETKEHRKEQAVKYMKELEIYQHYITSFLKKDQVCEFVGFGG